MMPTLTSYTDTLAGSHPGASPGKAAPRKGAVSPLPGHVVPAQPRQPGADAGNSFAALLPGHVAPVLPQQLGAESGHSPAASLPDYVAPVLPRQLRAESEHSVAAFLPSHVAPVLPRQPDAESGNSLAVLLSGHVAPVLPRQPSEESGNSPATLLPGHVTPVQPRQPGPGEGDRLAAPPAGNVAPVQPRQRDGQGVAHAAVLLPDHVAPVLPRQGDGEDGNILPAVSGKEDERGDPAPSGAWIAPPIWLVTCPPPASPEGEVPPLIAASALSTSEGTAPLAPAPVPELATTAPASDEGKSLPAIVLEGTTSVAAKVLAPVSAVKNVAASGEMTPAAPVVHTPAPTTVASPQNVAAPALPLSPAPAAPALTSSDPSPGEPTPLPSAVTQAASPLADGLRPAPMRTVPDPVGTRGRDDAPRAAPVGTDRFPHVASASPRIEPPVQAGQVAPAAQMFAAAIHRATRDERRGEATDAVIAGLSPTTELAPQAASAIEHSRHAALDMARATWPAKMIERIEVMRDAIDMADTSIRLVPDKLGTIDVSLRREGDGVAVQFTAQQAETRQLLADAQPKLAELAEAKGLKLSTQAGNDPGQQQSQQQRAPAAPLSTIRHNQAASADEAGVADERIA